LLQENSGQKPMTAPGIGLIHRQYSAGGTSTNGSAIFATVASSYRGTGVIDSNIPEYGT
jgi:hypothetical protein